MTQRSHEKYVTLNGLPPASTAAAIVGDAPFGPTLEFTKLASATGPDGLKLFDVVRIRARGDGEPVDFLVSPMQAADMANDLIGVSSAPSIEGDA